MCLRGVYSARNNAMMTRDADYGDRWMVSARHLSSQGTCELHLSRDSLSLAYSSWLRI
jgi:hypothetical protein